jgi:hypothetical protein
VLVVEREGTAVATFRDVRERWAFDEGKSHLLLVRLIKGREGRGVPAARRSW